MDSENKPRQLHLGRGPGKVRNPAGMSSLSGFSFFCRFFRRLETAAAKPGEKQSAPRRQFRPS
jgi:hypothetical protein